MLLVEDAEVSVTVPCCRGMREVADPRLAPAAPIRR